jgi:hypothetical protein
MGVVNIASLNRAAETYQKDFMLLPYAILIPVLRELKLSLLEVDNKDIVIVKERQGGAARPYVAGGTVGYKAEISKLLERSLQTYTAYAAIKDNITNYKTKRVLYDATKDKVNNQTKQHPMERDIIADVIKTIGEDIIDALFHATRNTSDLTPQGMSNGFNTLIDADIVAGEVSIAKGNLVNCGSLAAPANASDITAYNSVRNWLRSMDVKWRNKPAVAYIPYNVLINVKDALENKKVSYKDVTFANLLTQLQEDCGIPNLQIVSHYCLGTGTRMILTEPGNLDLGMNSFSDVGFVQVRAPYEDANDVQFWMQFEIGQRIKNLNKRGFMVSDGTAVSNPLSGDYDVSGS